MDIQNTNFQKLLNEAAQSCSDVLHRRLLHDGAAEVGIAVDAVYACPSLFNIINLNGAIVRAKRTFDRAPPLVPPSTPAGRIRPAA